MILVTGGHGALAQGIVEDLLRDGTEMLVGTRAPSKEDERVVDFDRPETLPAAFKGVDVLVMVSAGYAEDDVVYERHRAAVAAAEAAGVRHVVYTSLIGAGDHLSIAAPHRFTERLLTEASLDTTILRNGLYAELFFPQVQAALAGGVLELPWGSSGLRPVAREDLAAVAASVASEIDGALSAGRPSQHAGRVYELDGTEYLDGEALAGALSEAAGRPVAYRGQPLEAVREQLSQAGLVPYAVAHTVSLLSNIQAGHLDRSDTDLPKLLARPIRDAVEAMLGTAA